MNQYRKFEFASLDHAILCDGFWKHRTDNYKEIINSMLEAVLNPTNSVRLTNFGIAAGEVEGEFYGSYWSDGDCYKFLEGCCYMYQRTKDPEIKQLLDKYIPWIVKSQQEDGYINTQITLTGTKRWDHVKYHELYNIGHFLTFAVAHFNATGETVLIECSKKLVTYLYSVFSGYPVELGHFGSNPSQIMGLCDLYKITQDDTCYKLAEIFVNMRGSIQKKIELGSGPDAEIDAFVEQEGHLTKGRGDQNQDRIPLREETIASGHAVTSTYLWSGAADVYAQTGEKALMDALTRIWEDMTTKRSYITGASSPDFVGYSEHGDLTHESHSTQYVLPNKIAYNETCANIGNAMWSMRMLANTEDTKYGDFAETVMYNAGISGSNLQMTRYFYSNPLSYRKDTPITQNFAQYVHKANRRWHTFTCWCCPPQLFRNISSIGRWVYGEAPDTLYINLFTSADYITEDLQVKMNTQYPWEDQIRIEVVKAHHATLKIRIPAWCKSPLVNGTPVPSGQYFVTTVNTGDQLDIVLPMEVRIMQSNPHIEPDRNMVCVQRGPVVYCAEGCDNTESLDDIFIDPKAQFEVTFEKDLLDGVVTLKTEAVMIKQDTSKLYYDLLTDQQKTTLKLIPYYAWANREESDMSVWLPRA